jgi:hypothetical protein
MTGRSGVSFDAVLGAARELVAAGPPDGRRFWRIADVARPLREQIAPAVPRPSAVRTREDRLAGAAFYSQVGRALDRLAAEGALAKYGAGMPGPDGSRGYAGLARYYPPAAAAAASAERAGVLERRAEIRARWDAVRATLTGLGLDPVTGRRTWEVGLDLDGWEALIKIAGYARSLQPARREDGPGGPDHAACGCGEAGRWGATGIMPGGHHWHWRNAAHTSGYLAHDHAPQAAIAPGGLTNA